MFIPSTLNGSCIVNGVVNDEILCKNLETVIDVYISRVDQSRYAGTPIHLFKRAKNVKYQEERTVVNTFLKSTKKEKAELKNENTDLFYQIQKVCDLRRKHMVPGLPKNYVFFLVCCYEQDCIHSICQTGNRKEVYWLTGGPSLSLLPIPTPVPARPYGNSACLDCKGTCSGHYLKPKHLLQYIKEGGQVANTKPPSDVLRETFQSWGKIPLDDVIQDVAKKVPLAPAEVLMWMKHLQEIKENRKKGAEKATGKRKKKRQEEEEICLKWKSDEPPGEAANIEYSRKRSLRIWRGCSTLEYFQDTD